MSDPCDWLPGLMCFEDFGGDWDAYMDALYECFCEDFLWDPRPMFCGLRVGLQRVPEVNGRHGSFWHLLSDGKVEEDRLADLRRCERIRWARALLDVAPSNQVVWWKNKRGRDTHIVVATPDFTYAVILADRKTYTILCSAYHVASDYRRGKFEREYEAYWEQNG